MTTRFMKEYQNIWLFIEGKLSVKEQESLLNWLAESDRNQDFFDQVVQDYELFLSGYSSSKPVESSVLFTGQKGRLFTTSILKVAAGIALVLSLAYLFSTTSVETMGSRQAILLYDSTQIILSAGSQLIYDSVSFPETHKLQIQGKARVIPPHKRNSFLLIETDVGYYFSKNAEFIVSNQPHENLEISTLTGEAQWISSGGGQAEVGLYPGEKLWVSARHGGFYKQNFNIAETSADLQTISLTKLNI